MCLHRLKRDGGPPSMGELRRYKGDTKTATNGTWLTNQISNGTINLLLLMCKDRATLGSDLSGT